MKTARFLVIGITLALLASCASKQGKFEYLVSGTLYGQRAAENKALQYQAFELARVVFDKSLKKSSKLPRAIIVDVDETVLDNSPYQGRVIKTDVGYPTGWDEWCNLEEAEPIPGALEFLNYAKEKGASVFYVTNRKAHLAKATLNNLKKFNFPDAVAENLLPRTGTSSKEPRRQQIARTHNIVLLMGDNLNDFSDLYRKKNNPERVAAVHRNNKTFGTRFIVLPNAMYGEWEGALYEHNFKLSPEQKDQVRKAALKSFEVPAAPTTAE